MIKEEKGKAVEFSVVQENTLPEELKNLIQEKKNEEFKLTFDSGGEKYIVIGYGRQETSGYSISIEEMYETENAIYVKTTLLGPSKGQAVNQVKTYPYIVLKIEYSHRSVVFE